VHDQEREDYSMKRQLLAFTVAACAGVLLCSGNAKAQDQYSSSGPQYQGTGITTNSEGQQIDRAGSPLYFGGPSTANAVFVGGTPIMRVRFGADGYSPEERAAAIQERLNKMLSMGPIVSTDITVEQAGTDAVVLVKGQLMFTADRATARYDTETPLQLASGWADKLRSVLPELTEAK
jgi:hypothetical protein